MALIRGAVGRPLHNEGAFVAECSAFSRGAEHGVFSDNHGVQSYKPLGSDRTRPTAGTSGMRYPDASAGYCISGIE